MACSAECENQLLTEQHSSGCVAVIRKGAFSYSAAGQTYVVGPGSVILGNAGQEYEVSHEFGIGDRYTLFEYPEQVLKELDGRGGSETSGVAFFPVPVLPPTPRLEALHRLVWVAARRPGMGVALEDLSVALASEALTEAVRQQRCLLLAAPSSRKSTRSRMRRAAQLLESRAGEPLTLCQVASALQLSPFHFVRLFRQEFGLTPRQFLIRMRLRRAIGLLLETALPENEIASVAGFGNLSHLSRSFHRHVGCPPSHFRGGPTRGLVCAIGRRLIPVADDGACRDVHW
ncbi:MAG: AraC family transcriptional regulator [Acidobacteriota bacterium]